MITFAAVSVGEFIKGNLLLFGGAFLAYRLIKSAAYRGTRDAIRDEKERNG
jgi:hypothetical protein